jgi:hypothetical protein
MSIAGMATSQLAESGPREDTYKKLVTANWTELFNDASLCLSQIASKTNMGSVYITDNDIPIIADAAARTMNFLMNLGMTAAASITVEFSKGAKIGLFSDRYMYLLRKSTARCDAGWLGSRKVKKIVITFLASLNRCFRYEDDDIMAEEKGIFTAIRFSFREASQAFLSMARDVEDLLHQLSRPLQDDGIMKLLDVSEPLEGAVECSRSILDQEAKLLPLFGQAVDQLLKRLDGLRATDIQDSDIAQGLEKTVGSLVLR